MNLSKIIEICTTDCWHVKIISGRLIFKAFHKCCQSFCNDVYPHQKHSFENFVCFQDSSQLNWKTDRSVNEKNICILVTFIQLKTTDQSKEGGKYKFEIDVSHAVKKCKITLWRGSGYSGAKPQMLCKKCNVC